MIPTALRRLAPLCVAGTLLTSASAQTALTVTDGLDVPQADALMAALDVGAFSLQSLELPADPTGHVFVPVVFDDELLTLALRPHVMLDDDYTLSVDAGSGPQPVESSLPLSWRGSVSELPGSRVAARIADGQLDATIFLGPERGLWGVQPANEIEASMGHGEHVVFSMDASIDRGWTCAGDLGQTTPRQAPEQDAYAGAADDLICEIAIDADFPFYQSNGSSVANTEADIIDIMNRVEVIYTAEVNIQYEITEIIVRTNSADPYTTNSPSGLLNQFASEWNANQGSVQRDVAHLFTGTNLSGSVIGIASLNVICSIPNAYGLSQSKFSSNKTSRAGLTAHELGHNWSSPHCDGNGGCAIMCSGLGGCTGNLTVFGPNATNSITNKANSSACLEDAVPPPAPTLLALSEGTAQALLGEIIDVTIVGQANKVQSVEIDGVVLPQGIGGWNVLNDTTVSFGTPVASHLGATTVQLFNAGGSSNVLTYDVLETDPPQFTAPSVAFIFSSDPNVNYAFGTAAGDTAFFVLSVDGTTLPFKGYPFLVNAFFISAIPLNAAGVAEFSIPLPPLTELQLATIFAQVAFYDSGLKLITPVKSTLLL